MQSILYRHPADSQPAGGIEGGILSVPTVGHYLASAQVTVTSRSTKFSFALFITPSDEFPSGLMAGSSPKYDEENLGYACIV